MAKQLLFAAALAALLVYRARVALCRRAVPIFAVLAGCRWLLHAW